MKEDYGYGKRPMWQWIAIYVVLGAVVYGLIYYFKMANNGGYSTMTPQSSYVTTTPSLDKVTVPLAMENASGESGTAIIEEIGGKVQVTISLKGYPTDGTQQPAHIHVGACPGVGAVKYPLTSVVGGASVTILDVTMADLKAALPLAINVHKSAAEAKVYTACGALGF